MDGFNVRILANIIRNKGHPFIFEGVSFILLLGIEEMAIDMSITFYLLFVSAILKLVINRGAFL